ncbi:MAG TPA: MFS transporter [Micromonosporaceae bacterium]|nr:MFS transporter [Micromonosporaceae bacterium]
MTLRAERRAEFTLWLVAILAVAANLRPAITSLPPLVDQIAAAYGLSAAAAGALTTLPVLCMGVFAPAAAPLSRRFGDTTVLAASVGVIGLGAAARAVETVPALYGGTVLAGIGIAVAGTLLPAVVRARMPDRIGPVTGQYTAVLIAGGFVGAATIEPLREALRLSPQGALALWAIPAIAAFLIWLAQARTPGRPAPVTSASFPWRSGAAWLGTLFLGMQSLLFYSALAWLAAAYIEDGMSTEGGGVLLGIFMATQVVTALALPALAHRTGGDVRPWIVLAVGLTTIGLFLVAVAPLTGTVAPWIWAGLIGLGMGGTLSLTLVVVTRLAPEPGQAAAYTGMAFFGGYLLAALGPVAAGSLRDLTGEFAPVFGTLAGLGVVTLAIGLRSATLAQRHGR